MGSQNIERNTEYKMQYDYPNQLAGEGEAHMYVRVVWVPWHMFDTNYCGSCDIQRHQD